MEEVQKTARKKALLGAKKGAKIGVLLPVETFIKIKSPAKRAAKLFSLKRGEKFEKFKCLIRVLTYGIKAGKNLQDAKKSGMEQVFKKKAKKEGQLSQKASRTLCPKN